MTAAVPTPSAPALPDERTRAAWEAYRDELHGLEGRDYDEAEPAAWHRLQSALEGIDPGSTPPAAVG